MRKLQIKFPSQIRIFGWDFGSSARAMNQMGGFVSTQADLRKVRGLTFFERKQMSTKTSIKRIALVAVSALGFGLLTSIAANAADEQPSAGTVTVAASTNIGATATSGSFLSRTSFSSGVLGGAVTVGATKGFTLYLATAQGAGGTIISRANGGLTACNGTDSDSTDAGTAHASDGTCALAAPNGTFASYTATFGDLAAGTYVLVGDVNATVDGSNVVFGTVKVVDAGTPATISWTNPIVTEISASAVDYAPTYKVLDANGVSTVLVNSEHVGYDVSPQTGVTSSQVIVTDADTTSSDTTPVLASLLYSVNLDGAPAGATGSTISGTQYSITGQLQDSTSAIGAPVVAKYTRLANTSTLTGSLAFTSDTSGTSLSSLTLSPNVASSSFYVKALDANGGLIKGATVALSASAGSVDAASRNTDGTGYTAAWTTTQTSSGSATLTAKIVTGASSISSTLTTTTTAFGATAATASGFTVKNNNGSGVKAGTAPAWSAAPNVTSFAVTISGLDASVAAKLTVGGTASSSAPKVNGVTGSIYPVADASGKINVTLTAAGANSETVTLAVYADGSGAADTTLTITYTSAAGAITTSPAASSLNMSTPSATNGISASVADQYGNVSTGGSVTITNTSVPAGATAVSASTVLTDASGKATVNAVVGATLGSYGFSIQAKDANGSNVGSASSVTYQVTATGIAGSLTLGDSDSDADTSTSDNASTRTIVVAPTNLANDLGANTANVVDITVTSATPTGLSFSATATNGIRLFTTDPKNAPLAVGAASVNGTAGTTHIYAVPTLVGAGTITVTSGGLTKVFTLTGVLASGKKAQLVTLTAGTNGNGKAAYTVKTTDVFGNTVAADVNITMSGAGYLSNGFKNMTVTTLADGTNSFDVISDGSAASGITATIVSGSYQAVSSTQATAQSISASKVDATASVTVIQPATPSVTLVTVNEQATQNAKDIAALTALVNALTEALQNATDIASEANDNAKAAIDAAQVAAENGDAATAAAQDATEAVNAVVEQVVTAQDFATEATDAANAATDAANAAAEAADNATAAAQDAQAAVTALATQLAAFSVSVKAQITTLTNLVIKIQKKVNA